MEEEILYPKDRQLLASVFELDLRVARLETAMAKVITRIDPTVSFAQALELLRK